MKEIINIIKTRAESTSEIVRLAGNYISNGLRRSPIDESEISLYEAFCVQGTLLRINLKQIGNGYVPLGLIIDIVNMALMSKLFSDNGLFNYYSTLAISLCGCNNLQQENYVLKNICSILNCDIESLEYLHQKRVSSKQNKNEDLHCDYFPFNFDYEVELIKAINSQSGFNYPKEVSPTICDLIVELELYCDDML